MWAKLVMNIHTVSSKQDLLHGLPVSVQQVFFVPAQQSELQADSLVVEFCFFKVNQHSI